MKHTRKTLALLLALVMCLTAFPLVSFAGYDTASAHVNSVLVPEFTFTGEYAEYGQIAVGDPFDLLLGWTTYTGDDPQPVGEIKEIALVAAVDPTSVYILYKDGTAYYGATATVNGNDALLKGVDSTAIQPGSYFTYVTAEDDGGVNTMRSTTLQAFSMKTPENPGGPGGGELGFAVEPYFFKDGDLNETVNSIPIGSEFALSVYVGEPEDVLLMELVGDGEPLREYVLYEDGQIFYGGKIDNEAEGPGWMTGFSSAEFEPGDYYLKVATVNGADGTHEPCITFTGTSNAKTGPVISTKTLSDAQEGEAYSATLKAEAKYGGAITWSIASGALPTGLSLNGKTGVISGTPKSGGTFHFAVKATEAGGSSSTASLTVVVKSIPRYTVSFSLDGGKAASGADYSQKSVKEGGTITLPPAPTKSGYKFVYWVNNGTAYLPGTVITVQGDMSFSAEYTLRAPLKVNVPKALNDAVGNLWLTGTDKEGNVRWLWSDWNPQPLNVEVPQYNLRDKTFTKLELHGYVDGVSGVVLATYTGTVTEETESVTLAPSDIKWQTVRGVEVTGVPATEYDAGEPFLLKSNNEVQYFKLPFMTTGQTFKVGLSAYSNAEKAAQYDLNGEYTTSTIKNGKLVITPLKLTDSAEVKLDVEKNGNRFSGTVIASQTVGGLTRTVRGNYSAWNDVPFTLHLYPGVEARFSLEDWSDGSYLFEGATLASPKNGATHTIKARSMKLDAYVSVKTDSDPALALRYIQTNASSRSVSVTPKGKTSNVNNWPQWTSMQSDLTIRASMTLRSVPADSIVTASYSSDYAFDASADVTLKEGEGAAHISAKLRPGILVRLGAETTSSCFFAWFDSAGKYFGCGRNFYLSSHDSDVASACPAGKAGHYTVALLPSSYRMSDFLTGKTLSDLTEQIITSWPVTLTDNGVKELAPFRADAVTTENAIYVTKPYSTMQVSAESFSSTSDVLCFSGSIGLDPGLENGKLETLRILTKTDWPTAYVSSVMIGGKSYPLTDPQWNAGNGWYYLQLKDPVDLPCTYSIYASPVSASRDVEISVTADTLYKGVQNYVNGKVGEAEVKRPGAFISVPSTYVCADTTLVSGMAKPNETVDVYDNGALVSTAAADWSGAWAANVQLYETDDTYTTVHQLWAESASGVVSNTATVIHRKNGPQLLTLNLVLDGQETGDTYFYVSSMEFAESVKYRLVFANPDQLEPMKEWNNAKAVVKVYMGSGNILFVEALPQTDGSFVADLGSLNGGYIEGAEAIYIPKNGSEALMHNKDESFSLTATAEEARQMADALSDMRGLLTTDKKGKLVYSGITDNQSFRVSFNENNKATVSGGLAGAIGVKDRKTIETFLTDLEKELGENGLRYKELSSGTGSGRNILEWLNETGAVKAAENKEKGENATISYSQRTQIFSAKESFDNTKTWLSRYATDAKYSDNAAGSNHARYVFGKNTAADIYTITDCEFDEDGNYLSGSYRITAELLADTTAAPAIYTASVTAEFFPNFKGFSGLKAQAQGGAKKAPGFLSLFTVEAHASEVDVSGLYGITFDGKYSDDPAYEYSGSVESLAGDVTNHTGLTSGLFGTTSGLSGFMSGTGNAFGFISMGASIYHLKKTWDNAGYRIKQEVRMRYDLQHLIDSTCYKRLTQSKRQLVDEAMNKYKKAEKNFDNWDGWSTGLSLGLDVAGVICGAFASTGDMDFAAAGLGVTGLSYAHGATLGKGANKAYQKMINQYEDSYRTIKNIFQSHAKQTGLDDCKKLKKDESNNKTYQINHDPSGIVYEGVIENPVKGATVTLWYGVDANGQLVLEKDTKNVKKVVPAAQVKKSPMETVQTTGADGKYAWFVPQGLWYVTAEYAGLAGNSNADKAATVKVTGVKADGKTVTNLLPVLPEQLDVNIPLVDKTAPVVESVRYTDEGIYVTFNKYMVDTAKGADSVLNAANYALKTKDGAAAIGSVKAVEQGHTPSNIDGDKTKTYTRTVLIVPKTALKAGTEVLLTVKKAVRSYAGTALAANFTDSGTVLAQKALSAPVIAGGKKQTVAYGSGVTITLPEGAPENARIFYTVNGDDPATKGRLYEGPFAATNTMTVKAVAVCTGYPTSAVASADFLIDEALTYMPAGHVRTTSGDPAGLTVTLTGGGYTASATVAADGSYVFHDVPVGSYTLSFAGNDDFRPASVTVTVSTFDPWTDLALTDKNTPPDYIPGDVDGDGKISSADARLALRRSVNLENYPEGSVQYLACDVDADGEVTSADARLILRASVGLEDPKAWKKQTVPLTGI